jgi:DNA processing protein
LGACAGCLRRSWLLAELSPVLDRNCRADDRLFELLALEDSELIAALGGRRRGEIERSYARLDPRELSPAHRNEAICCHDSRYPRGLADRGAPRLLHVAGGLARLCGLANGPLVTILGAKRASEYGAQTAHDLARELASSGVTVIAERAAGIALAVQQGALEGNGATITVAGDGLAVPPAKARGRVYERLTRDGCVVAELPADARGRAWGATAGLRIAVGLGATTVVVEAEENPRELRCARIARELGRPLAAVPGQITSPRSSGCHALLRDDARLVRDAEDVLDVLYGLDRQTSHAQPPSTVLPPLPSSLREVLKRVGAGTDTPSGLTAGRRDAAEVLKALSELELLGLLGRGDGGRYVIRDGRRESALRYGVNRTQQ